MARIGTSYKDRSKSALCWRLGPTILLDEQVPVPTLKVLNQIGPSYLGNFQGSLAPFQPWCCSIAPRHLDALQRGQLFTTSVGSALLPDGMIDLRSCSVPLFPELSIVLAIKPGDASLVEVKSALATMGGDLARKVLLTETQMSCPTSSLTILPSISAVGADPVLGYFGGQFRSFRPATLAMTIEQIGGVAVVLKLISTAATARYFKAAVALLVLAIKHHPANVREMERVNGYAILGMLLESKHGLLSSDVLDLIVSLTWLDRGPSTGAAPAAQTSITNAMAFRELLLNYNVWRSTPEGLSRLIFAHVRRLVVAGPMQSRNVAILRDLGLIDRFLAILQEEDTPGPVAVEIGAVLSEVFALAMTPRHFQLVRRVLISTMTPEAATSQEKEPDDSKLVRSRNTMLQMVLSLLTRPMSGAVDSHKSFRFVVDQLIALKDPGFFNLFLARGVADSTVQLALRITTTLLSDPKGSFHSAFKLKDGYATLGFLLPLHCHIDAVHLLTLWMLFGYPPGSNFPPMPQLTVTTIKAMYTNVPEDRVIREMLPVVISLVKALLVQPGATGGRENSAVSAPAAAAPALAAVLAQPKPKNPFGSTAASEGPSLKSSNPFGSTNSSGSGATAPGNPFTAPPPPYSEGKKVDSNPFGKPQASASSSAVSNKLSAGNPFAKAGPAQTEKIPIPTLASSVVSAATTMTTVVGWEHDFATTMVAFLQMIFDELAPIKEGCCTADVVAELNGLLFTNAEGIGTDDGVVNRKDRLGRTIRVRLCEPGGWPLRGLVCLNNHCRLKSQLGRFITAVALESLRRGKETRDRGTGERTIPELEALLYALPKAPADDRQQYLQMVTQSMLTQINSMKLFVKPDMADMALAAAKGKKPQDYFQHMQNVGFFAVMLAEALCWSKWGMWHSDVLKQLIRLLTQVCLPFSPALLSPSHLTLLNPLVLFLITEPEPGIRGSCKFHVLSHCPAVPLTGGRNQRCAL